MVRQIVLREESTMVFEIRQALPPVVFVAGLLLGLNANAQDGVSEPEALKIENRKALPLPAGRGVRLFPLPPSYSAKTLGSEGAAALSAADADGDDLTDS